MVCQRVIAGICAMRKSLSQLLHQHRQEPVEIVLEERLWQDEAHQLAAAISMMISSPFLILAHWDGVAV